MECPCGEDIDDLAMKYSRRKEVDPVRCDGCLDIIFGRKWRNDQLVDNIEKSMDHSKAIIPSILLDEADMADPKAMNHAMKRLRTVRRPELYSVSLTNDPGAEPINIPESDPAPRFRSDPDPNCKLCAMARSLGKVERCECMKI